MAFEKISWWVVGKGVLYFILAFSDEHIRNLTDFKY